MNRNEQIETIKELIEHIAMASEVKEYKKDWKNINDETLTVMMFMLTWVDERMMR